MYTSNKPLFSKSTYCTIHKALFLSPTGAAGGGDGGDFLNTPPSAQQSILVYIVSLVTSYLSILFGISPPLSSPFVLYYFVSLCRYSADCVPVHPQLSHHQSDEEGQRHAQQNIQQSKVVTCILFSVWRRFQGEGLIRIWNIGHILIKGFRGEGCQQAALSHPCLGLAT
jgi:hypothetical protein